MPPSDAAPEQPSDSLTRVGDSQFFDPRPTIANRTASSAERAPRVLPAIPGYDLIRELDRGGMGVVYEAQSQNLHRRVALKIILGGALAGDEALHRFLAEAEALAAVPHPNIVQVFERGEFQGLPYFTMEFCPAGSLAERVKLRPLPARDAARLVEQMAHGVAAAHAHGILHRDLKPENVLFAQDGTPKIADFGLAKRLDPTGMALAGVTQTGAVMGTPSYMSPEQARGDTKAIGPGVDIYALGAILYHIVTGRPPFLGASAGETLRQVIDDEPVAPTQLVPGLPRDLATICLKCLAKEPARRYASADDLAADLRRYLDGQSIAARPVGVFERAGKWVRRNPVVTGATAAVILALALGTAVSYRKYLDAKAQEAEVTLKAGELSAALTRESERVVERDAALRAAGEREQEKVYQLGISEFLLASAAFDNRDVRAARERLERVPAAQRQWEWHYLHRQCDGGIFTVNGHTSAISSLACSADGARVVTGSWDMMAKVWNARTGTLLAELRGHTNLVSGVAFNPDMSAVGRVATVSFDGSARLWDDRTGTLVRTLRGHKRSPRCVAFSPDGQRLATGGDDQIVHIWDVRSGKSLLVLRGHQSGIRSLAFSPDGRRLVTGAGADGIGIWDAHAGTLLRRSTAPTLFVVAVDWSPDGARLALACADQSLRIVDARTATPLLEQSAHARGVTSVAFSPDGTRLVTGGADATARIWDARSGKSLADFRGHRGQVLCAAFSPDGLRILTASEDQTFRVWDADTATPALHLVGHTRTPLCLAFEPGHAMLATGSVDGTARVWDARTGREQFRLAARMGAVTDIAYSPNEPMLATASYDGVIRLWNSRTGSLQRELRGHTDQVRSLDFNRAGSRLVSASYDQSVKIWDVNTARIVHDFKCPSKCLDAVFSPDDRHIATIGTGKTAEIWDALSGTLVRTLTGHAEFLNSIVYSPDGTRLATASYDRSAIVWDAHSGKPQLHLKGHTDGVGRVVFNADGSRLATASNDKTVRIWDARTGTPLLELKGHADAVVALEFGPERDGVRPLATAGHDLAVRIWDTRPNSALGVALTDWDAAEYERRLLHTRSSAERFERGHAAATASGDAFAVQFYLERLLAMPTQRTIRRWQERCSVSSDPRIAARTSNLLAPLAKTPYDRSTIMALAAAGDVLSWRLLAQESMREGRPQAAIPLLYWCLVSRPRGSPPVEELLLAAAYLRRNQMNDARRLYRAAVDWLEQPRTPLRAANTVTHAINPWNALAEAFKPIDDPRYSAAAWESWFECDVLRGALAALLR